MNINNSTISGNTASSGFGTGGGVEGTTNGDVNNGASVITINNSTISNNTAGDSGGGISTREVNNYGNVDLTLNRSLISGNSAAVSGNEINITGSNGTITAANYNLFGHNGETIAEALNNFTAYGGTDITATRDGNTPTALGGILSASVGNNGGSTYTNALFVGSPAQDAVPVGVANDCLVGSSADQRGAARANGSESGTACDIGAYELHQCTTTPTAIALMAVSAIQQELANSGLWAGLLGLVGLLLGFVLGWLKRGEVAEAVAKEGGG
ncbi:MAG: hypothetical protein GY796_27235 [Chloroflexi bacterium]|nr:hypothetical protein [Chloroflexota bacterium]